MLNLDSPKQRRWRRLWPAGFIAILAIIQLILTMGIVGMETGSLITDSLRSMIFAGYFCSIFFTITWISMFTVACCNRHSCGCATHVLVENILSIVAASVLLYFDTAFLDNPYKCYYGLDKDCSPFKYDYWLEPISSYTGIYNPDKYTLKVTLIKTQLACAAVMLTTNVVYLVIYTVVALKTSRLRDQAVVVPVVPYGGYGMPTVPFPVTFVECRNYHTRVQIA